MLGFQPHPGGIPAVDRRFAQANGLRGHVAGVSFDGGNTWQSVVIPGLSICSGRTDKRVSDPWLSFAPNGDLYASTFTFTPADGSSAIVVNIFQRYQWKNAAGGVGHYATDLALLRSSDKGQTWEGPIKVADVFGVTDTRRQAYARDPDTGDRIRAVSIPDVAVDPNTGNLYAVWEDARFSFQNPTAENPYPSITFAMSTDGSFTWSEPIQVNQTPTDLPSGNQQALHTPVCRDAEPEPPGDDAPSFERNPL